MNVSRAVHLGQQLLFGEPLTEAERAVLDFATTHTRSQANRLVERELGLSPTRYWQQVLALCRRDAAATYAPGLVASINGQRTAYGRVRSRPRLIGPL